MEWKNPPPSQRRVDIVREELHKNPGQWAKVASHRGFILAPWWLDLENDYEIEVRRVHMDDLTFGDVEIYAKSIRRVGDPDA
jgi:hypothetical protein